MQKFERFSLPHRFQVARWTRNLSMSAHYKDDSGGDDDGDSDDDDEYQEGVAN